MSFARSLPAPQHLNYAYRTDDTKTVASFLRYNSPRFGTINLPVRVQEVATGVVRLLSGRSVPVGTSADLVTARGTVFPTKVSRCTRLPTGLFEVSLAINAATSGMSALPHG